MKTMIICADGLEECEALMTYDLLYRAGIDVELVGLTEEIVSSHHLSFTPHKLLKDADPNDYDCLVLPGGMPGTLNLENDRLVQTILTHFLDHGKLVCAICAAPSILLHRGLLKDGEFTCFPGFEGDLRPADAPAIRCGNIITGKGLGAVVDFASLIIETLVSKEKTAEVLQKIQYGKENL